MRTIRVYAYRPVSRWFINLVLAVNFAVDGTAHESLYIFGSKCGRSKCGTCIMAMSSFRGG